MTSEALHSGAAPDAERRARRISPTTLAGVVILLLLAAFGSLGPILIDADPARQDLGASLAPIGGEHLLGADHFGRSMLARLAHGTRISFGLALVTVAVAALPGTILGLVAAWKGGWTDRALALLGDAFLALPGLLLVLLVVAFAPGNQLFLFLGLALALWVEFFRVTRATARGVLALPQVEAARLLGFGPLYIARHHLWPALAPTLLAMAAFGVGTTIVAISTLSFISVGLRPPTPEWGNMMVELMPYLREAPLHALMPAVMIFLAVLGCQLVARGVQHD